MKSPKYQIAIMVVAIIAIIGSCTTDKHPSIYLPFNNFSINETLTGDTIDLMLGDVNCFGKVFVGPNGYVFSKYNSDSFLLYFNPDTREQIAFAPKGDGPDEITGVSGFGEWPNEAESVYVFDPYKYQMYKCSKLNNYELELVYTCPKEYSKLIPWQTILLNNGKTVAPRGDHKYGMVSFDSQTGLVEEWPLGLESVDIDHPNQKAVSGRRLAYSPENGLIIETYDNTPFIIMHNEDGSINKVWEYKYEEKQSQSPLDQDAILSIAMTRNNIWILYGKPLSEDNSHVFVYDYDGNPIANLCISSAMSIAIDEKRRKLISVNPNNDITSIMYQIPEEISLI